MLMLLMPDYLIHCRKSTMMMITKPYLWNPSVGSSPCLLPNKTSALWIRVGEA